METTLAVPSETPAEPKQASLWQVSGPVPAAKISPLYKLGMAAVATAMVLLPLLYVALIGGVGYATYRYAITGLAVFEGDGGGQGKLLIYLGPLVIGALVVVFMIKPLFARRPQQVEPREISRQDEPQLFEFIERICDLVHAPRPRRVQVDLQVNASASFRRGFLSLFSQDLTLTIGLPLAAGLNVRQLGGVLAHEFGHFAQGAGMRLTFVIRSVSGWFSRVVYERDAWDEGLESAARNIDLRIGIILHLARFMIWLTRKLLWVFMMTGHAISCFMLRQMEFDADHYETQVSGSRGFGETAEKLRLLSVGWQRAISQQQEAFQGKRLVDNLPGLIAIETQRLPTEVSEALDKAVRESKTGWFDTHPADADRVRAAEAEAATGVLTGEEPATGLFADFSTTSQLVTKTYYRDECELDLDGVHFSPLSEMAAEASTQADSQRAMKEFFGELLSIRSLLSVRAVDMAMEAPKPTREELEAARTRQQALLEKVPEQMKELMEADTDEVLAFQARALIGAGFKLKKDEFKLPAATRDGAETAINHLRPQLEKYRAALDDVIAATRERLTTGLRLLGNPYAPDALPAVKEAAQLVNVLEHLSGGSTVLVALRNDKAAMELLLHNASNAGDDDKWTTVANSLSAGLERCMQQILAAAQGVNYPFAHASGTIALADFLGEAQKHENEHVRVFFRAQTVLDRYFSTYARILARLATLAREAEMEAVALSPAGAATT